MTTAATPTSAPTTRSAGESSDAPATSLRPLGVRANSALRFTISRSHLAEALSHVLKAVPTKMSLPVLGHVLVETTDRGVRFGATDLDVWVKHEIATDIEHPGAVTLPAKTLIDIVREMPDGPVQVIGEDGHRVRLVAGRARFKLVGLGHDEVPSEPTISFAAGWTMQAEQLQRLIRATTFAASDDPSRPILSGVLWQLRSHHLKMVATNGHRLALAELPAVGTAGAIGTSAARAERDLIVPPKALDILASVFGSDVSIEIATSGSHLTFRSSTTSVCTRLIEGPYPQYEAILPKDYDRHATIPSQELVAALKRMTIVASDRTHRIRMSLGGDTLRVSVQTPDVGEAHDDLAVQYAGEPFDMAFNAKYLIEVLHHLDAAAVRMTFKTSERAALFEPATLPEDGVRLQTLVMPLRITD